MKRLLPLLAALLLPVSCTELLEPETPEMFSVSNTRALDEHHQVIYELNLYNFTAEGTLQAAKARLQELRTLGIDIVWLMPIQTRSKQGKIGTLGSPYALHDYTEVNPDHGELPDLQAFVDEAHHLGMEVWMDWVPNHTGLDHVWVSQHPEYYKQSNGKIVHPNNYGDVYQLDYGNAGLRQAMTDAIIYWVEKAGIDGFRFDYISSPAIPASFWQSALPAIRAAAPDKHIRMLAEGDLIDRKDLYDVGFDYDYAWGFHDNVAQKVGATDNASLLRAYCRSLVNNPNYDKMDRMVYLTNHDDGNDGKNYFSDFGSNVPLMTVLEFTLYGMPLLYNGQEIGYRPVQDYFNRSVINWNNGNAQLRNTIATLVALRHRQPALGGGPKGVRPSVTFLEAANTSVFAYLKQTADNTVLVVLNLSSTAVTTALSGIPAGRYSRVLDSRTITEGPLSVAVSLRADTQFDLPAKGYCVYVMQ